MALTIHDPGDSRLPERAEPMAKADLRKTERALIGRAIKRTQELAGLSLKEFAATVQRDERQVARWIDGSEAAQIGALLIVATLRPLLVIAFAEIAGQRVRVSTHIDVDQVA